MEIHQKKLSDIKPYQKNPRKKQNVHKVANSIKEFGFQQPIVVDRAGVIIVGHSRYLASQELGLETVPVVIADLDPLKAKAYRIADNRLNQDSLWDYGLLNTEFTDFLDNNYDLLNLGFDEEELENLINFDKEENFADLEKLEAIDSLAPETIRIECTKENKNQIVNKLKDVLIDFEAQIKT